MIDWRALLLTLQLATVTTVGLLVLAAPLSYALAFSRLRGKAFLEALVNLPLAVPPTVVGFYLLMLMGPRGVVGRPWEALTGSPLLFTFAGIALASLIYSLPFAVQPMRTAFEKIDRRLLESAYVLGLPRTAAFFRVILPNSLGGLAASAILIFLHSMGAFGVLLMVGGSIPGQTRVLSIAIYEAVEAMDYAAAARMSLILLPVGYLFLLLVNRLLRSDKS